MKKTIQNLLSRNLGSLLALAIFFTFLPFLAQVTAALPETPQTADELHVGQQDNGRRLQISEDQILVLTLDGNPSTGYMWVMEESEQLKLQPVAQMQFISESDLIGAPGKLVQRFRAVEAGSSTLNLSYRRPWEDAAPLDTFSIVVEGVGTFDKAPPPAPTPEPARQPKATRSIIASNQPEQTPPSSYNWCDLGGCTPVRNQGNCGACWAFATVGVLELQIKRNDGLTRDLSEQYLVSCNTDAWSCDGGWWAHDYHQDKIPPGEPGAGAVYETEFPYVASDVACNPPHDHYEKITNWNYVDASSGVPSVADLKQAIYDHGPIAVAICVGSTFNGYNGGVFVTDESSACNSVNHGVVLVGWDDNQGIWHLRNSWGASWGENGYMRIGYGVSRVGYGATYVTYAGGSPTGPLVYSGHTVDDDSNDQSSGNGDGQVDCGETIELLVDLHNQGSNTVVAANAILSTSSPYVTITDSNETWPDIPGGETRANTNGYVFSVDPGTPNGHVIQFDLDITASNGGPWSDSLQIPVACVNEDPPGAPTALQATGASQTQINLAWTDNSDDETGFRIERSPNGSSSWATLATVGANVSSYSDSSLSQDTRFYYRVCAYNGYGDSDYTNVASARTWGSVVYTVYLPLLVKGGQSHTDYGLPIDTSFEAGQVPPSGWTLVQTNPRQTWKIRPSASSWDGAYYAHCEYDSQLEYQNEVLLSPPFQASSAQLQFHSGGSLYWCRDLFDNCDLNIWVVVGEWGGLDDILVHTADSDWVGELLWSSSTVNLTPYLPDGTPVRVGFQYEGLNGDLIGIDAIHIAP